MRPEAGIRLPHAAMNDVLDYLCAAGQRQQIYFLWRPALPDPSDDLVLGAPFKPSNPSARA